MAPRSKFTRQELIDASFKIVRERGSDALTAKAIADELHISTRPIFTCFGSMDEVRREVRAAAEALYDRYTAEGFRQHVPFFGFGMQYIRFAKEEPELYRLLFLSKAVDGENGAIEAMPAFAGDRPAVAGEDLPHPTGGSRPVFPRPVAGGAQSGDADRRRRLPLFRIGNRADPHRLQRFHLQIHQGNSRLRVRRL